MSRRPTTRTVLRAFSVAAMLGTASCSVLLDWNLNPNPEDPSNPRRPDEAGAESGVDGAPAIGSDAAPATGEAGADAFVGPAFPALVCPGGALICADFENAAFPLGADFTRDLRGTSMPTRVTNAVGAGAASLSISTGANAAAEQQLLAFENEPIGTTNGSFTVSALVRIDGAFTGGEARTLITVRPFATIDSTQAARAELVADAAGVTVRILRVDATGGFVEYLAPLSHGVWHRVDMNGHFDDNNGRIALSIDSGAPIGMTSNGAYKTLASPGSTVTAFSVGLGVSANGPAPPMTAAFDNVVLTTP